MLLYKSALGPSVHKHRQIGDTTSSVHTIDSHHCSHILSISGTNFFKSLLKIWKEARFSYGRAGEAIYSLKNMSCNES